jgi:hypothetical protein
MTSASETGCDCPNHATTIQPTPSGTISAMASENKLETVTSTF